ncbi:MAG: ABC transporter permease [Acidobacteriota bacterium]
MLKTFAYRDLIWELVARDLKVRYRRSAIGFLWSMLQPLMIMAVLHLVFSTIFRFEGFIENYAVYVLAGILFWNFFSQSIIASMNSLRGNAQILQKLPVPMAVFPIATVLSGVINLLLALVPLFLILLVTGHPMTWALLFLPVSILIAVIFTLGAGLLLSPLAVLFTDVTELVNVILTVLFYATPIIYPMAIIPADHVFFPLVRFNPARSILEVFRDPIFLNKIPPITHLSVALIVAVVALIIGTLAFRRLSSRIPFHL